MKNENLLKLIVEEIQTMNEANLIELNNIYCESINAMDNIIYSNDEEFFELLDWSGLRVAQSVFYGDYNYSHDWVTFDGYGNLKTYHYFTYDELVELPMTMAEYISENYNEFEHLFSINIDTLVNLEQ